MRDIIIRMKGRIDMAVTYKKLFHLMIDEGISNAELMERAGFSANIITKLKRETIIYHLIQSRKYVKR